MIIFYPSCVWRKLLQFKYCILKWYEVWRFEEGVPGWFSFRLGEHTQHRFVPIDAVPGKLAYAPPPMPATVMAALHSLVSEESMHNTRSLTLSLGIQQHLLCFVLPVLPSSLLFDLLYVLSFIVILYPMLPTLQHAFLGVPCFKLCKFWAKLST